MMGKQRIRKKRRRRIQKQNIPIAILSSITIILIFVWGGLYWKESTKTALIDPTGEYGYNWEEMEELPQIGSKDTTITPVASGQAGVQQVPEGAKQPEAAKQEIKTEQPEAPTKQVKDNEQLEAAKLTKGPVTKSNEQSKAKSDTSKQSGTSDSIDTNSKTSSQSEIIASKESKYEQELVKLKAKSMKDMNVILEGAETSIQQLDKTNPIEVQAWQDKITNEISNAESTCERNYLALIQSAEKDSVSASKIDEWTLTYNALYVKLQDESRAKLQNLMGE
ncbi:hypothetical protein BVG16_04580 [Paenibacillus selenitireducens]|uniref:Uncharacterized protein n=1 Tax=Paenibacillus selenitireducens TaxID=1324314 RepID=A0A1T2XJN7_9BACL|nr:hypothetical protein [Paenibacillus selenitireducens]OPA80032.1 hypothetical protein BVG16_04580 [Paenibacillus selenitireducens]